MRVTNKDFEVKQDTQKLVGSILEESAERDAIHVAVAPVIAGQKLWAGAKIGFSHDNVVMEEESLFGLKAIGIVDPFLQTSIEEGQRFFMFLNPGTVTTMKHYWEHPSFPSESNKINLEKKSSEEWLRAFANKQHFDYNDMLSEAQDSDGCIVAFGQDLHSSEELDPGDFDLFWQHISVVTERTFDQVHRQSVAWSCSC